MIMGKCQFIPTQAKAAAYREEKGLAICASLSATGVDSCSSPREVAADIKSVGELSVDGRESTAISADAEVAMAGIISAACSAGMTSAGGGVGVEDFGGAAKMISGLENGRGITGGQGVRVESEAGRIVAASVTSMEAD